MAETTMPAAEVSTAVADDRNSYELAFHVLPTVAEGEVSGVFEALKALITKKGAEIFDEEAPERFDLAYKIVKHLEGKNRSFSSAYFGWVRFYAEADAIEDITEEIEGRNDILRHLLIKLTKAEQENPFRFHEALASEKMVTTVDESSVVPDTTTVEHNDTEEKTEDEEDAGEANEEEIEKALAKDETEEKV